MPAFLIPVHESNDCHTPAGSPAGGQFCAKRGWHLTSDPHFVADPTNKPEWNSLGGDLMGDARPAGLFVTELPEYWMEAHGYERPYVAQVEGTINKSSGAVMYPGREEFMQGAVKTVRVLTIDEYAREVYGEEGWVESYFSKSSRPAKMPKGYKGRSVAEMSPAEIAEWERKFAQWAARPR